MSDLPPGWATFDLGTAGPLVGGKTPSKAIAGFWSDGDIPWTSPKDMKSWEIVSSEDSITRRAVAEAGMEVLPIDSVLMVTRSGILAHTFPVAIARIATAINQDIKALRPNHVVQPEYAAYALRAHGSAILRECSKAGTTVASVNTERLEKFPLPLAPRSEQSRIAEKIDGLLSKVDSCREKLDRIPQLLKKFREAVLEAAVSGRLTEEWRNANAPETKWRNAKFEDLGQLGRGKSKHRPRNDPRLYGGPYPFIQTGDIAQSNGTVNRHTQTYSEFGLAQSQLWPTDTVCITIAANIADTAILAYPACFPDSVVGFIADKAKCEPLFVKWLIDVRRRDLESFAPATAQKNINLAVLNGIELPLPSLAEQSEIVRRVTYLLAYSDSLTRRHDATVEQVDILTPSVLAKAFRGELVPQDPNDEPAGEMMQRLQLTIEERNSGSPRMRTRASG